MQRIIYTQDYKGKKIGNIDVVSNNIAHGLFELGVAEIYSRQAEKALKRALRKEMQRPPVDKMMRADDIKTDDGKKGRYVTK